MIWTIQLIKRTAPTIPMANLRCDAKMKQLWLGCGNHEARQLAYNEWFAWLYPCYIDGKPSYVQLATGDWLSHDRASSKLTYMETWRLTDWLTLSLSLSPSPSQERYEDSSFRFGKAMDFLRRIDRRGNSHAPRKPRCTRRSFLLRLRMVHFIHHQQWYRAQPRHGTDLFGGSGRCGEENVATTQVVSLATWLWVRDLKQTNGGSTNQDGYKKMGIMIIFENIVGYHVPCKQIYDVVPLRWCWLMSAHSLVR